MPQTAVKHRCTSTGGCEGERTRGKAVSKTTSARPRESSHVLEKVERSASRSVLKWFGVHRRKVICRVYRGARSGPEPPFVTRPADKPHPTPELYSEINISGQRQRRMVVIRRLIRGLRKRPRPSLWK
ncbi:hypothetical protein E2C01_053880 [Portunus trituberculatus]|uniref:Uncharacterized protein n=1 Tax=Portunus trituberculatus TaxID=210409 RepID=A0A5B7GLI8_PORTR|nr:hypothetical protein [Portunus trituberculatus]